MNHKFALFYVAVISVTLVGSLYASRLNAWNHMSFSFPPETQKIVENRTATMEIQWQWLPDTLEMIIKINDDEFNETSNKDYVDWMSILFDSDHSGNLSTRVGEEWDDHGVFIHIDNASYVLKHCLIYSYPQSVDSGMVGPSWLYSGGPGTEGIARNLNDTYCLYKEGEGYTFKLSILIEFITVSPSTPIYVSFQDADRIVKEFKLQIPFSYQCVIAAEFVG